MRDTSAAAEQARLDAIRRMDPATRLAQALAFSEWARRLALAGLRERYPGRSDLELVELLLGEPLVPRSADPARR